MAQVNIMAEAQALAATWQEQKEQANRDFLYTSGKLDGLQEFISILNEKSNAPDNKDGEEAAPSSKPNRKTARRSSSKSE